MDELDTSTRIQDNKISPNKMPVPKEGAGAPPKMTFSRGNPVDFSAEGEEVDLRFVSKDSSGEQGNQEIRSANERSHQGSVQTNREGEKYQPNEEINQSFNFSQGFAKLKMYLTVYWLSTLMSTITSKPNLPRKKSNTTPNVLLEILEQIGIEKKVAIDLIKVLNFSHPRELASCSEERWKKGCKGHLKDAEKYWSHVKEFQQVYNTLGEESFTSFEASVTAKNLQKDFGMEFPNDVSPIGLMNSCSSDTQMDTSMFPVRNQKPKMVLSNNNNPQGGHNYPSTEEPPENLPKATEDTPSATPIPRPNDVPKQVKQSRQSTTTPMVRNAAPGDEFYDDSSDEDSDADGSIQGNDEDAELQDALRAMNEAKRRVKLRKRAIKAKLNPQYARTDDGFTTVPASNIPKRRARPSPAVTMPTATPDGYPSQMPASTATIHTTNVTPHTTRMPGNTNGCNNNNNGSGSSNNAPNGGHNNPPPPGAPTGNQDANGASNGNHGDGGGRWR